jgi:tRNA pseudouridine38-40 synthase
MPRLPRARRVAGRGRPTFRLVVEYNGTRYSGWQVQQNARTVQGELLRVIGRTTGQAALELYGSGRTDAGVHALMQVAHLSVATTLPSESLRRLINDALPSDIHVVRLDPAPGFHARHDAVARSYLYQIARRRTAFAKPFVWWIRDPLDLAAMRAAAALFAGMKDYRSFTDADARETSTLVLVDRVLLGEEGDLILIRIEGSHFLWKMVRRMVGVLAEVGRGAIGVADVEGYLREQSDVPARLTAPAAGLFLERVFYRGDPREHPLRAAVPVRTP